jgi:WD40 repeat protein
MATTKLLATPKILATWLALHLAAAVLCSGWAAEPPGSQRPTSNTPRTGKETAILPANDKELAVDARGDPLPPGALTRCGTNRLRHGGLLWCAAVSPDGKTVASAGDDFYLSDETDPVIRLWDAGTGKELRQCRGRLFSPVWVRFSPDGKTLASLSAVRMGKEQTVHLWDVATGKQLHILKHQVRERPAFFRYALAFSADGRMLASSGADATIRLWDVTSGSELRSWSETGRADALAFSPDGKVLAAGVNQYLSLLDVNTGASRRIELEDSPCGVSALQFSPDGKVLVWSNYREQVAPDGRTLGWANCIGFVHW